MVGTGDPSVLRGKLVPHGLVSAAGHDSLREVNQALRRVELSLDGAGHPQGVVRKGAVGSQGLEQVLAPERQD